MFLSSSGLLFTLFTRVGRESTSLASLLNEVTENREVVIIQRRGSEDVAMIAADELAGILETAHLLRSP
jgi:antitoxin YefM